MNNLNKSEYQKLVKQLSCKEKKVTNTIIAFLVGGLVGLIGELTIYYLITAFGMSKVDAGGWLCLIMIFASTLFTSLGFFDNWVAKCKCGLIIPTTGFAHSVASSALDYRKDGLVTGLGANFFKLAGSVILYGVISAFILVIVRVIIGG